MDDVLFPQILPSLHCLLSWLQEVETVVQDTEYVEEEPVDSDLTLVQQDITSAASLGQSSILGQTGLQDPLGLSSTNLDQQILNQQVKYMYIPHVEPIYKKYGRKIQE